jgi:pantoate--beta-alanine ligase
MRTIRTVAALRETLLPERRAGRSIGLVPTMGALHDGHLALLRRARSESHIVVMSLFVNPTQFGETADLEAYPRDEARDAALAAELGVDVLFAPAVEEMYPQGFATTVSVAGVTEPLEGTFRGQAHFDGVTTVVCKLLNMVGPDVAYFGQKDAQQALVIQRLVADLNLPVQVAVCPTVREPDGLAMSSRNVRLSRAERERALALSRTLASAQRAVEAGVSDARTIAEQAQAELESAGVQTEYFEIADPETLAPLDRVDRPALALVAARIGTTRLIDNQLLAAVPAVERSDTGDTRCSARC